MPALASYSDFLLATKVAKITSLQEILNEAVKNTYLLAEMLRGRGEEEIMQAGQSIKDSIQLNAAGTFEFYSPNAEFSPTDDDVLTDIGVGWRFAKTHYGFSDETIALNRGTSEDVFVDLKAKYEQSQRTDMMNGMEDSLWAVPVTGTMESGTGDAPPAYSIPAFVNEATNGVWPGWTTVETVNPSTESRWRPQQVSYDATNIASEENGILAAFDDMFLRVKFESPEEGSQYFENDRLRKMKIITSRDGHKKYKRLLRGGNDQFVSPQDPAYNSPTYAGIPLKYIAALDTAALEITSQTTASGSAYPVGRPRYFWLNFQYLFPVYHTQGYMEQVGPIPGGITQPFSHAVYHRTWYNMFCRSRQRQGIVFPA